MADELQLLTVTTLLYSWKTTVPVQSEHLC